MNPHILIEPADRRIHFRCGHCRIDKVALTYAEARRDLAAHRRERHGTPPAEGQQW